MREHPVADVLKRLRGELEVVTEPELVAVSMVRANIERILGNPPRDESIRWPPLPELETLTMINRRRHCPDLGPRCS